MAMTMMTMKLPMNDENTAEDVKIFINCVPILKIKQFLTVEARALQAVVQLVRKAVLHWVSQNKVIKMMRNTNLLNVTSGKFAIIQLKFLYSKILVKKSRC
jgi:hypothetical protein